VVAAFVREVGPDLEVSQDVAAGFAWQLVREQTGGQTLDDARTHQWLAQWLGVDLEATVSACSTAQGQLAIQDAAVLREQIYSDPKPFLDAFAIALEAEHGEAVQRRILELAQMAHETGDQGGRHG